MKILHCADIHLGSKMDSRLPAEKAEERKRELRSVFSDIAEYAKNNGIAVILLAGDIFDSDRPLKKDKEFFYSVVKNNPQIDFLYLRGNHDLKQSFSCELENLKIFKSSWTTYEYGNVRITGAEMTAENSLSLYSSLKIDADKINIVMMHGQTGEGKGGYLVNLKKLANKNIDYLALGHIHSYSCGKLDDRGIYAYPGCPEGRGFDEEGEKGFILLDAGDKTEIKFIPFAKRKVVIKEIDISASTDAYSAYKIVKNALDCNKNDILRVVLTGDICYDGCGLEEDIAKLLCGGNYYYCEVRDKTNRKTDITDYEGDVSIKGEFVRLVLKDKTLTEEKKKEILSLGIRALEGRDL